MLDMTIVIVLLLSAVTSIAELHVIDDYPHIVHPLTSPEQQMTTSLDLNQEQPFDVDSLLEYDDNIAKFIYSGIRRAAPSWAKLIGRRSSPEVVDTRNSEGESLPVGIDELTSLSCTNNDETAERPECRGETTKLIRDERARQSSFVRIGRGSLNPPLEDHVTSQTDGFDADRLPVWTSNIDRNRKQQSLQNVVRRAQSSFIRIGRPSDNDEGGVGDPIDGVTSAQSGKHHPAISTYHLVRCINEDQNEKAPLAASLTRLRCRLMKIASGLDDRRPEVALQENNDDAIDDVTRQMSLPTKRYSSFVRIGRATRDVSRVERDVNRDVTNNVHMKKVTLVPKIGTIDSVSPSDTVDTEQETVKNEAFNTTKSDKGDILN